MRRSLIAASVLVLLVLLGAGTWLLLRAGLGVEPPTDSARTTARDEAADAPVGSSTITAPEDAAGLVVGTVRRGGETATAEVTLHLLDDGDPEREGAVRPGLHRLAGWTLEVPPTARVSTDDGGRYRLPVPALGAYTVRACAEDGATATVDVMLATPGLVLRADLRLPAGRGALRGRAVRSDGTPFVGLLLVCAPEERDRLVAGPVATAEDGSFRFGGLPPGLVLVHGILEGRWRSPGIPIHQPRADEVRLVVDAGLTTLRGRVLAAEDDRPIPGAEIRTWRGARFGVGSAARTLSGEDGRFEIPSERGVVSLRVRAGGYAPRATRVSTDGEAVVRLLRPGTVRGRVVDDRTERALASISVRLETGGREVRSTTSGPDGRFAFEEVPPGEARVFVLDPARVSRGLGDARRRGYDPTRVTVEPGGTTEVDLRVVPAARVAGRVRLPGGDPAPGVRVSAVPSGVRDGRWRDRHVLHGMVATATAGDGSYSLAPLVPGHLYSIRADSPLAGRIESPPFRPKPGPARQVDLEFPPARWIDLRVVEAATARPVDGARVKIEWSIGPGRRESPPDVRTLAGHARLGPVPPGELRIEIVAPGRTSTRSADRELPPEFAGGVVVIEIPAFDSIAGRVVRADGGPVPPGTLASLSDEDAWDVREESPVEPDGRFAFRGLPDGRFFIRCSFLDEGRRIEGRCEAGSGTTDVVLRLEDGPPEEPGPTIEVRVLSPDGEGGISGRFRDHRRGGRGSGQLRDGSLILNAGQPRHLEIVGATDRRGRRLGAILVGPVGTAGGSLEIRLPAERTITGTVRTGAGRPIRGALVRAVPVHEWAGGRDPASHGDAACDAAGAFEIGGLGEFEYRLAVSGPPDLELAEPVVVPAGARDVGIVLRAVARHRIVVLGPEGLPLAGAEVTVNVPKDPRRPAIFMDVIRSEITDDRGEAVLLGLDASGSYELHVEIPPGRTDLRPSLIRRTKWSPTEETVRFERAYSIRGTVHDLTGRPLDHAGVYVRETETDSRWREAARTDETGRFEIRRLPEGRYVLTAAGREMRPTDDEAGVPVDAGTEGVDFRVDPGGAILVRVVGEENRRGWDIRVAPVDGVEATRHLMREGRVRAGGLPSNGRYDLCWQDRERDLALYLPGLRTGQPEIVARLAPASSITGKVVGRPEGADGTFVRMVAAVVDGHVRADREGAFRLTCIPPGTWPVEVRVRVAGEWRTKTFQVSTGTPVTLRFE